MPKKLLAALALLAAIAAAIAAGFALAPDSAIRPIAADSPCPAAGCASGACHGFDAVPEPDGAHEMMCPEAGCASVECHGWNSLIGRYHQASDMSLNVWVLMPVTLVLGLWLLVRRAGRGARPHGGADVGVRIGADAGVLAVGASPRRPLAKEPVATGEEEACYEA